MPLNYTVENISTAHYVHDLDVKEVCIKFAILEECEAVNEIRSPRGGF